MNKFEEAYRKIIAEEKIIKESVDENKIKVVIKKLESIQNYVVPGKVKKTITEVILLLKGSESSENDEVREVYVGKTDEGNVKAILCKDKGEDEYYFILNDDFDLNEDWISYDNDVEFDNQIGTWESKEECLKELKDAVDAFWGINFEDLKLDK